MGGVYLGLRWAARDRRFAGEFSSAADRRVPARSPLARRLLARPVGAGARVQDLYHWSARFLHVAACQPSGASRLTSARVWVRCHPTDATCAIVSLAAPMQPTNPNKINEPNPAHPLHPKPLSNPAPRRRWRVVGTEREALMVKHTHFDGMRCTATYLNGSLDTLRLVITGTVADVPVALADLSTAQLVRLSAHVHAPVRR